MKMIDIRKIMIVTEETMTSGRQQLTSPVQRAVAMAVFRNPMAGRDVEDLSPLFNVGATLGELLMARLDAALLGKVLTYGKAAIIGTDGDIEHGAAILHPKLGKPVRAAVGGGEAIIPSNVKLGSIGTTIDIPLSNKDNIWSFDELDTITVAAPDAPAPDEIVLCLAVADSGRPRARVGSGRAVT